MERIEGRNPVREALRAGRVRRILVAEGAGARGALAEILSLARAAGVRVERVSRDAIEARAATAAHQGVVAEVDARPRRAWREAVASARAAGEAPLVLAVDRMTDPRNLGALLRSAEAFGAHAAILPERRTAPLSAVAAKASAGAVEHLPIDRVGSLERALAACRAEGLWIVALDAEGDVDVHACDLLGDAVVIVVGSEGRGVSRLVRERADATAAIPMAGSVGSLSAPVAGAVALWEARRRRIGAPG